jgi:hypothetical protein
MTIESERMVGLVRKIVAADPAEREAGAENASDWADAFDEAEARMVAAVLSVAASAESSEDAREAQLHAIFEISTRFSVAGAELDPLRRLRADEVNAAQSQYLVELGISPA